MYLKLIIFFLISILFIVLGSPIIQSQENKPFAIIAAISKDEHPEISEQILLKHLKDELSRSYDLSFQSEFEITLQKMKDSSDYIACLGLKCILRAYSGFEQTDLFLILRHFASKFRNDFDFVKCF